MMACLQMGHATSFSPHVRHAWWPAFTRCKHIYNSVDPCICSQPVLVPHCQAEQKNVYRERLCTYHIGKHSPCAPPSTPGTAVPAQRLPADMRGPDMAGLIQAVQLMLTIPQSLLCPI